MIKLAKILKENNIRFRWTIFTDLNLYNKKPIELEEVVYMKPSYDFTDYIKEANYGVQLSDTEGYSYFINECLQQGTPVICTNFPSAIESVENEINGYILDMELKNLNIDKIVNNIPKNFKYIEKCTIEDWTKILNREKEKSKNMYKITAKQDYTDTRPELIEEYNEGSAIKYNNIGNAEIKKNDVYLVNDSSRANTIKESGFATVEEIKEETKLIRQPLVKNETKKKKKKIL